MGPDLPLARAVPARAAPLQRQPLCWSAFTQNTGKTLLVALNYTTRSDHFPDAIAPWDGTRRDQEILDHLSATGVPLFDMNAVHQREYEQSNGSYGSYHEYLSPYMVNGDGHYNPRGNHFFAYALKDTLLELLDPKPLPYQDRAPGTVDFSRYLPGA
jgi:hypothetical protein